MSDNNIAASQRHRQQEQVPFRLSTMVAAIGTAVSIMAAGPLYAADDKVVTELQAEIANLKQALEKSEKEKQALKNQQELTAQKTAQPAPTANEAVVADASTAPAEADSKNDEPQSLETVVVRSRNRLESVKDVPVSISVVTGKELDRLQARDLSSITQRAANISWGQGNARTSSLSIRGIGKQAQTDAMDPSVGITVDGVSYAYNPLSSFDFYDVDAVEVARGPQGTLRGKNASVGAVTITTKRPTFTDEVDYSLALGQNNRVIANTAIGGAVIDDLLAWRGAFTVDKGQGDFPNKYNNDFTYKNKDNVSGRVQFLLTPNSDFNALFKVEITPKHEEYYNGWTFFTPTPTKFANGATNPLTSTNTAVSGASVRLNRRWFTQDSSYSYQNDYLDKAIFQDNQRPLVTATNGASAVLNWNLGSHTLTSVTGFKNFYFQARNDEGTPFDISKNGGGFVKRDEQFSQELRLASEVGGFLDYQVGTYLLKKTNNYNSRTGFGSDAGAWFATNAQYTTLDANSNGRYLLQNSLSRLETATPQHIDTKSAAIFGQANWHLSEPLTFTTGARLTLEDRNNWASKYIATNGYGAELNPVSVNGVQTGGFNSDSNGLYTGTTAAQLAVANATALKYFGVATYAGLSAAQMKQVAAAKALRLANLGTLYGKTEANTIRDIQPTLLLSPSYKFNDNVTGYVSFQYGEKAGIAQVLNGQSYDADAEKNTAYELGLKSLLLDKTLTLNADLFLTNIKNYQQQVQVADATSSTGYSAVTGNAAGVRAYGVELDAVFTGISHTSLRFSGAYNNAYYTDFKNSSQPVENNNLTAKYRDVTGENLPGAAKFTFNVGADYRYPVFKDKEFHTSFNTAYTSRYNSDVSLSKYAWIPSYSITDFAIGIGRRDKKFDTSLLVKNLFNDDTSQVVTWNSYVPAVPRWIGIVFSGEL